MALPDYNKIAQGTSVIWGQPAGSGVTLNISVNVLANNAGRMGQVCDLGTLWDREHIVMLAIESGTAPTAGLTVELYFAATHDTSQYPSTIDGTDAAFTVANRFQLGPPILVLYALNVTNTRMSQSPVIWMPPARYVVPVVINFLGQSIRNVATAANNLSRIFLTPRIESLED